MDGQFDSRICDYTGKQYCPQCHWNETICIPARIIHNWDFEPRTVSRQSKQLLQLRNKKADINLHQLNPALFNFLDELRNIKVIIFISDLLRFEEIYLLNERKLFYSVLWKEYLVTDFYENQML